MSAHQSVSRPTRRSRMSQATAVARNHGDRFTKLMDGLMPNWRSRRDELNAAPLGYDEWAPAPSSSEDRKGAASAVVGSRNQTASFSDK
jgi:hypothetical protein